MIRLLCWGNGAVLGMSLGHVTAEAHPAWWIELICAPVIFALGWWMAGLIFEDSL